ncbi:hypothetical protein J3E61_006828 [Mycobacterium sp. OAE908]
MTELFGTFDLVISTGPENVGGVNSYGGDRG